MRLPLSRRCWLWFGVASNSAHRTIQKAIRTPLRPERAFELRRALVPPFRVMNRIRKLWCSFHCPPGNSSVGRAGSRGAREAVGAVHSLRHRAVSRQLREQCVLPRGSAPPRTALPNSVEIRDLVTGRLGRFPGGVVQFLATL
jgi:hypothetical protein